MSSPMPPIATPAPAFDQAPQEEQRDCPVCMGAGQIPASMGREEILQAIDANMPNLNEPERGEMMSPAPTVAPTHPHLKDISPEARPEVNRLGARAKARMNGPKTYGMG